jgi:hypothetical protein
VTSLSALSSLTSLTKLKTLKAAGPGDTKPATTTPTPAQAQTVMPEASKPAAEASKPAAEAPKPAASGPASVIGARTPAERVSLGTILTLQASSPRVSPEQRTQADGNGAASTQANQPDGEAGPSLDLLKGQAKPPTPGDLGALRPGDLAGESAKLQNLSNRQPVGAPGYGLTAQNPQSLLHLFA